MRLALAAAVVVAPLRVTVARAQASEPPPGEMFEAALAAYDAKRYDEAIELFLRTYRRTGVPGLLFNIAQSARLLGDCPRAVAYYGRFVVEAPTSSERPLAEAFLRDLGDCGGAPRARPEPPPPAAVPPRPPPAIATPSPASEVPMSAQASAPPTHARSRIPAALLFAGSVALGSAGGVYAARASDAGNTTSEILSAGADWNDAAIANDRNGRRAELWSRVLLTSAAVFAAAGLTWLLWPASKHGER